MARQTGARFHKFHTARGAALTRARGRGNPLEPVDVHWRQAELALSLVGGEPGGRSAASEGPEAVGRRS